MRLIALCTALGLLLAGPALALDRREALDVVSLLEHLASERGETVYANGAEDWFEYDANQHGLIEAAGYGVDDWNRVYEDTIAAYLAGIPDDEYAVHFKAVEERIANSDLSAEHKQALFEEWRVIRAALDWRREAARPYAELVRPLAGRISVLMATD